MAVLAVRLPQPDGQDLPDAPALGEGPAAQAPAEGCLLPASCCC